MRFAVVGAGTIGQLRADTIRRNPATELAGVLDVSRPSAERAVSGTQGRVCSTLEELLDLPQLEAVIVSSPLQFHEATGFNHRYYPAMKFLKRAIDDGLIGTLDHVRVFGGHDGLHNFRADWQYKAPDSGGGAMMDVGIHMTDLARFILGDVTEVYGVSSNRIWHVPGSEDNAVAVFRSPEGVPATYEATWTEWKGYRFYVEAYGDRGMVRGYYAPMSNLLVTQDKPGGARKRVRKFYPEIMVREKLKSWTSTALLSFEEELADFLRMLGGERVPLADGFAGFRAVEIANAVYQSTAEKRAIQLSPAP